LPIEPWFISHLLLTDNAAWRHQWPPTALPTPGRWNETDDSGSLTFTKDAQVDNEKDDRVCPD